MANSVIPQDIIYHIIAEVGNSQISDRYLFKRDLKQCALVSSSFLLPSRKQLFSEISLGDEHACQRLHRVLLQNPVIQSFVRSISILYDISESASMNASLPAILRLPFSRLNSFSMCRPLNWNTFSGELKDALSNIVQSSTLKILRLNRAINVPITLLLNVVHLTELTLYCLSLSDFDCGEQSSSLTSVASRGVAPTTSHAIIDRCLWFFQDPVRAGPTEPIFLPFMARLRCLEIDISPDSTESGKLDSLSPLIRSLCMSLTSSATLEELRLDIHICADEFSHEEFGHEAFYDDLRGADVLRRLDSILTHSVSSRLQKVDIVIRYHFRPYDGEEFEPDTDEIEEAVLHTLPLLRKKGILFVEAYWVSG